jgi:signal transduction histidine kinase
LITSVLFFGKADENKLEFKPKKIVTATLIEEVLDAVRAGIDNDVTIKTHIKALPKSIVSDPELLYQVFENLLSNAVKYSKDGCEVDFRLSIQDKVLLAEVADKGIGIPKSEQNKMFDRFFRAKNVGIVEGSGLGLSIVKKCLDVLGGEIRFESEMGKGTTFFVTVPVK